MYFKKESTLTSKWCRRKLAKYFSKYLLNTCHLLFVEVKVIFNNMTEMFYFDVDVEYTYNVTMVQSKGYEQISRDIKNAIADKLWYFKVTVQLSDVVMMLLLLLIFIK